MIIMPSTIGCLFSNSPTPLSMSGLQLWLDANDTSTMSFNGSKVSQWNDKSGNNFNFVQSNAAQQATYQSAGFNNKPTLLFNNLVCNMTCNTFALNTALTIFVVLNPQSLRGEIILIPVAPSSSTYFEMSTGDNSSYRSVTFFKGNSGNGIGFSNGSFQNNNHVLTMTYNNGSQITSSYTSRLDTISQTIITSGALGHFPEIACIGRRSQQGILPFDGLISEILVYNNVLSSGNINTIENYLRQKWGF